MVAPTKEKGRTKAQSHQENKNSRWVWIALAGVVIIGLVVVFLVVQNQHKFVLVEGETEVTVLLHDEKESIYQIRHEGHKPVDLQSLQVMLAGQILHVDVKQVILVHAGQEIILESDGSLPPGTGITLPPGDTFDVRITMIGQTTGGNYLYGFRISYAEGERVRTTELVLGYDYKVFVE